MSGSTATVLRLKMAVFPRTVVTVRHVASGNAYTGGGAELTAEGDVSDLGELQGADGAVSLFCAEIKEPAIKFPDEIQVQRVQDAEPLTRYVKRIRTDQVGEVVRIIYGPEFG
jgi:hypothetical protein